MGECPWGYGVFACRRKNGFRLGARWRLPLCWRVPWGSGGKFGLPCATTSQLRAPSSLPSTHRVLDYGVDTRLGLTQMPPPQGPSRWAAHGCPTWARLTHEKTVSTTA